MRSNVVLLKNLLLSHSGRNILKYEKDRKRRGRIIGSYIGFGILYAMLVMYCLIAAIGLGAAGMARTIPSLCAVMIISVEFLFTLLKTNGYLFAFKDYDMLMSLPFSVKTVVSCKFLYMYIKNLPWIASMSLSMLVGYAIFACPKIGAYVLWIVLSAVLPIIPMVIASALGSLIAAIGSKFRYKQAVQTVFMFAFVILCFSSRYIIEGIFKNNQVEESLENVSLITSEVEKYLLPVAWFRESINDFSILSILLLVGSAVVIYELFFVIVSRFYRQINTRLLSGAERKKYKMQKLKTVSPVKAIAFKEFRRFMGSSVYMVNMGLGELLVFIFSVALLFVDLDSIIAGITQGAPVTKEMLIPAIPLIIYFLVGMCATTACSFSLEGKNFWIPKSLPISMKTLVQGKMLFNLYLTIPFSVLGNVCVGIASGASGIQIILFIVCSVVLCLFSTFFGSRCDLKHYKHDWDNEVEVIKQGSSVALYLLPNMFVTMGLVVGAVALGFVLASEAVILIITALAAVLAFMSYGSAMRLAGRL